MTTQGVRTLALVVAVLVGSGCVQPAFDRSITYELDVSRVSGVRTVGVRGGDRPLSWDHDVAMRAVVPGSLYVATVTCHTGYLAKDVKFTVNGEFELVEPENRRVRVVPTVTGRSRSRDRRVPLLGQSFRHSVPRSRPVGRCANETFRCRSRGALRSAHGTKAV